MHDVIVVGAGASGLMCAIQAGRRGLDVLVLEKNSKAGLKILVSGGGRCNFTNLFADPTKQFLSRNPHFCISALRRYGPAQFIEMIEASGIRYHEKKLGQLFCNDSAKEIVTMLLDQCRAAGVDVRVGQEVTAITPGVSPAFSVVTAQESHPARRVVIASGGLSLPKIASDLAYRTANRLGLKVVATRPALVPLTWNPRDRKKYQTLAGISLDANVTSNGVGFRENILFTHRGLSGPAILQASSYWRDGDAIVIDLLPRLDAAHWLVVERGNKPQRRLVNLLKTSLPNRLVEAMAGDWFDDTKLGTYSAGQIAGIGARLNAWEIRPGGCEGYRTAEVTLGGIDTDEVSSKTFELAKVPGLYAIGEALDVTGWLGGYNFQWAWASAWCCAQHL